MPSSDPNDENAGEPRPGEIPGDTRIWFWCVAWVFAALVLVIPDPICALFFLGFPAGVFRIFLPPSEDLGRYVMPGWLFYGGFTYFALSQKRRLCFLVAYAILCVFLILNVVGCNIMLNDPMRDSL